MHIKLMWFCYYSPCLHPFAGETLLEMVGSFADLESCVSQFVEAYSGLQGTHPFVHFHKSDILLSPGHAQ